MSAFIYYCYQGFPFFDNILNKKQCIKLLYSVWISETFWRYMEVVHIFAQFWMQGHKRFYNLTAAGIDK